MAYGIYTFQIINFRRKKNIQLIFETRLTITLKINI